MSGKHGFGFPKSFVFTSTDPGTKGSYTVWYRDTNVKSGVSGENINNFELVMASIAQFCESHHPLCNDVREELTLERALFAGQVTNRYGRVISASSFLPVKKPICGDLA